MSVLVYTENWEGKFRKSSFEAVSYASETAKLLDTDVIAISLGEVSNEQLNKLGNYGASKVITCPTIEKGDSQAATNTIANASNNAKICQVGMILNSDQKIKSYTSVIWVYAHR